MVKKAKTTDEKVMYCEDEIDLTPYIKRLSKRKWWFIGAVIIAGLIGYFGSYLLPQRYQINAILTYKGQMKNPVPASSVGGVINAFKNQISADETLKNELFNIHVDGKEYPLILTVIVFNKDNPNKFPDKLLETLNHTDYAQSIIEQQRDYLSTQIKNYNDLITKVEEEIKTLEGSAFTENICPQQTLAQLYSTLAKLKDEKEALQQDFNNLVGFVYIVKPYVSNEGKPIYPNKVQNAFISGFVTFVIVGGLVIFIKEKKH